MKRMIILLVLVASTAHGEIYTWTDSRGTAHYTNSLYEVPSRYRGKVKVLDLGIGPTGAPAQPQQPAPAPSVTTRPEEVRQPAATGQRPARQPRGRSVREPEE